MAAKNGVVIATDKKVSSTLVDSDDYQKIQNITPSTGTIYLQLLFILLELIKINLTLMTSFSINCIK